MNASLDRIGVVGGNERPLVPGDDAALEAQVAEIVRGIAWDSALSPQAHSAWWMARQDVKRLLDVVGASVALVLLAPVLGLVALLVKLDGGPVFYRWRVLGHRGRPFTGYKFRTMVVNADELKEHLQHLNQMSGPVFKIRKDPRVTRLGRFLRGHSIDELPKIWSVLKGDMSLVGPRPPAAHEFLGFAPEQRLKPAVVPGLTCLWQVSGRADILDFSQWSTLDLRYIREWSLRLGLASIARTAMVVVKGSGGY